MKAELDIDRLRADLFLAMLHQLGANPSAVSTEDAALLGEHAARLAKAACDGIAYFDRTGEVRDPVRDREGPMQPRPS